MKKVQANRYEKAVSEIEKLDKDQVGKINKEINYDDRNHFHVAMVRITDRPGEAKNNVSVVVQMFGLHGFQKFEKNFKFLGWTKLAIVHDPRDNKQEEVIEEVKQIVPELGGQPSMTEEQIEAEAERRANEKFQKLQEKSKAEEATKGTTEEQIGEVVEKKSSVKNPFENGEGVKEMKAFAEANEIDLTGLRLQAEIKGALIAWQNDQIEIEENNNKQ